MKIAVAGCRCLWARETLSGAVGTLSLTDSERESGYSISSLFVIFNSARLVRSGESMQNTEPTNK